MNPPAIPLERYLLYRQGALPPAELLELSDRLSENPGLRAELEKLAGVAREVDAAFIEDLRSEAVGAVPADPADFVAYLDGRLDEFEREMFEALLAVSPEAREDLADLRAFRDGQSRGHERSEAVAPTHGDRPAGWLATIDRFLRAAAAPLTVAALLAISLFVWPGFLRRPVRPLAFVVPAGVPQEFALACEAVARDGSLASVLPEEMRSTPAAGALMGPATSPPPAAAVQALSPLRTATGTKPVFRWQRGTDATGFRIFIQPPGGVEVIESPLLPAEVQEWMADRPLLSGTFTWEVVAYRGTVTVAKSPRVDETPARFRVLKLAEVGELISLETAIGDDPLLRAVAYARAGKREEALAEIERARQRGFDGRQLDSLAASLR